MNNKIQIHERCIEILEDIMIFENKRRRIKESLNGATGRLFPGLIPEMMHDIDIAERCIERLRERYIKQLEQL